MKMNVLFIAAILLTSCNNSREGGELYDMASAKEADFVQNVALSAPLAEDEPLPQTIERKLIRNGNLEFLTGDVRKTKTEIDKISKELGGYLASENENNYGNRLRINQTIRIPAGKFDELVSKLESLAEKVENKGVNTQDVTEEFIDVEARLKTKKELEARYREILKQAKTVVDLVSIEEQIANVRSEIESMEGRLKYLSNQVSFSTLSVSYYQESAVSYGFASKFINSLKSGWFNLVDFVFWLLQLWPFVLGIAALIFWWVRRKRKRAA